MRHPTRCIRGLGLALLLAASGSTALSVVGCGDEGAGTCEAGSEVVDGQCVTARDDRGGRSLPDSGVFDDPDAAADPDVAVEQDEPDLGPDNAPTPDLSADEPDAEPDVPSTPRDDGTCDADSEAIGFWTGTWDGRVWGSHPLVGTFDEFAFGTLQFEIYCFNSKLLIEGEMTGTANETFPFGGDLIGEYNPETNLIDMDLVDASVVLIVITVEFIADVTGELTGDTIRDGVWSGVSTNPTGATGEGTWQADRAP